MFNQNQENLGWVLYQFPKIPLEVFQRIRCGNANLKIIESEENLNDFLSFISQQLTQKLYISEKQLEYPYKAEFQDTTVCIYSTKDYYHNVPEGQYMLILTKFNNINYYAYISNQLQKNNNKCFIQNNKLINEDQLKGYTNFQNQLQNKFPQLTKIQNQIEVDYEELIKMTSVYENHDSSTPDISFYYNQDGSQAILFNLFCEKEIVQKVIDSIENFNSLFYNQKSMYILLKKEKSICLQDFDAHFQQYKNNSLPLCTYLSSKYEEQKKNLNKLGIYTKKNLSQIGTIPNLRLRQDLIEIYECLDKDLEFQDEYQDQYCYAYYIQDDNPFLLEGLIVGPEDTPFEGIVYTLTIQIPQDYPNTPPIIYFNENILHPNISEKGKICLDILNNKWSPALTLQKVLISIVSLLYEKNLDDVYNHYAKCLYIKDPVELKKQIQQQAIFSGCKKLDINYKEISKLSTKSKRKNLLQCNDEDEDDYGYDSENQDEMNDNYDIEEETEQN